MWKGKVFYKKINKLYEIKDGKGKESFNVLLPYVINGSMIGITKHYNNFFEEEFERKYFVKNKKIKEKKYQNDRTIFDKRKYKWKKKKNQNVQLIFGDNPKSNNN